MDSPYAIYKCASLVYEGIIGHKFQPYESHISYIMHFMVDYNLFGCGWLEFPETKPGSNGEFYISASKIMNRKQLVQELEHNTPFEPQTTDLNLPSLDDLRVNDSTFRTEKGIQEWVSKDMNPFFQTKSAQWTWTTNFNRDMLVNSSKPEANSASLASLASTAAPGLPTISEAVPSEYKPEAANHNISQIPDQEADNLSDTDSFDLVDLPPFPPKPLNLLRDNDVDYTQLTPEHLTQISSQASQNLSQSQSSQLNMHSELPYDCYLLSSVSPSTSDVQTTHGVYTTHSPFYSDPEDKPALQFTFAGKNFPLRSDTPQDLPEFDINTDGIFPRISSLVELEQQESEWSPTILNLVDQSPKTSEVRAWREHNVEAAKSQIPTQTQFSFQSLDTITASGIADEMNTFCLELILDKQQLINDSPIMAAILQTPETSVIISTRPLNYLNCKIKQVSTELDLLNELQTIVQKLNPDILLGYETDSQSWGLCRTRYTRLVGEDKFYTLLGRSMKFAGDRVYGRYILSLWSVLRKEVTLAQYSLEYVVLHTLHFSTPQYSLNHISEWFKSSAVHDTTFVIDYMLNKVSLTVQLLEHFEIIGKTCAMSRTIGVDFWSSLTRGSQYKVESVLARLAKRHNYVLLSPTRQQVSHQRALEYIPLVMEPISELHTDPVCVLDFRSLYPSLIIAFNLCYSTCLGKVSDLGGQLGVKSSQSTPKSLIDQVKGDTYVLPNGVAYVSPKVRQSLLAQMLGEILDTRFMLNDTKSKSKFASPRFKRNINNQQLALKFVANVTYGYTSASFSGRMPCAELADSIVSAGREILEWCISKIEKSSKWGVPAKVVYGDTDSLFVKLPGASLNQAFDIGQQIANMITEETPNPILLKLEKVYQPCILLSKKRYVGKAHESPMDSPFFDAKGIETIRRDGIPLVQRVEKRALQILFDSYDLSKVKSYLQNQWRQILSHKVSVQDLCFAQEVKLGHYKPTANLPGGAVVSLRRMQTEGVEIQYRERVPFVVCAGALGSRINERVVSPQEFLQTNKYTIDAEYYINQVLIPPLERLFNILGANIKDWYLKMPKPIVKLRSLNKSKLLNFVDSGNCISCDTNRKLANDELCSECRSKLPMAIYTLTEKLKKRQFRAHLLRVDCNLCMKDAPLTTRSPCVNMDCPIMYQKAEAQTDLENLDILVRKLRI